MEILKEIMQELGEDPFTILESDPNCEPAVLRKNYRSLAYKFHPDKNKQQSARIMFVKINRAYQFLQQQGNRRVYQNHIKALDEKKKRFDAMDEKRKQFAEQLKRRQQELAKNQQDFEKQLKKRKQFFRKKMEEEEEREAVRSQIADSMGTQKYYELVQSFQVHWDDKLSYNEELLRYAFSEYGQIKNIQLQAKRKKAIITFNSIDDCTKIVNEFKNPLIQVDFHLQKKKRDHLLKALQKQKSEKLDLSLTSANIERFKQIMNRGSGLYNM